MRIVSWNLGHQTRERPIKDVFYPTIRALRPDVFVLNEYVDGVSRARMKESFVALGLGHVAVSESIKGHNQILIASRYGLSLGSMSGPQVTGASVSNFLHVSLPELGLDLVGLRVPSYVAAAQKIQYWQALEASIQGSTGRNVIYIGDLNADPDSSRTTGGRTLRALESAGWQIPRALGDWSFRSSRSQSRIDHAIVASAIQIERAAYLAIVDDVVCAGATRDLYDHAPLVIEIKTPVS